MRRKNKGWVYFVTPEAVFHRDEESLRLVKIGFTRNDPARRVRALQCGSPVTLELHSYVRADESFEQLLHNTFSPLRCHGEWFFLEDKLAGFIRYFDLEKKEDRHPVPTELLLISIDENIICMTPPGPEIDRDNYNKSAIPHGIANWYEKAGSRHG